MKTFIAFFLCLLCLSVAAQKKVKLFNGKDLSGWKIHGTEKWFVEGNELVCESGPDKQYGYLSTTTPYKNFVLTLQFKQEANGNSGVFFRSTITGTKISGWQVEVAPLNHHTGGIYESYGRGWLVQPKPEDEKWLKEGKWNSMKIEVNGPHIVTWLNGHKIVDMTDEKIGQGEGFIALQIHEGGGIRVKWKNIELKEL